VDARKNVVGYKKKATVARDGKEGTERGALCQSVNARVPDEANYSLNRSQPKII
jgi:hypothetical protein